MEASLCTASQSSVARRGVCGACKAGTLSTQFGVLQANLIVRCRDERFKKVRVLRRTNSDSEHARMLAALDGIARRLRSDFV